MSLDPHEYDIHELRGELGNGETDPGNRRGPSRAADSLRSSHYRELLRLQSAASVADLEKPYLDTLPDSYAGEVTAFEWLEFLAAKGGFKHTLDALRYYRSMGWLSEAVETGLRDYLDGVEAPRPDETKRLDVTDHLLSLVYIARLASV